MTRKPPEPEEIFLKQIKSLINNILINNPNYSNYYYPQYNSDIARLIKDTKERANYVLDLIESTEHLIKIK